MVINIGGTEERMFEFTKLKEISLDYLDMIEMEQIEILFKKIS